MLPFLKKSKEAGVQGPVDSIKREHDEDKEQEFDAMEAVAEDLINALHSKDIKGAAAALKAAFEIADSQPHIEGPHGN